ncbi:hypothetical protein WN51_02644 [Melipona quadrifasciata]|uniref:Uncharacterized protein n=1 Tax=Melipona quadrifasciata TaxID=166423 RepID=A0A0N0BDL2_9HYME|nr:hypothetical protein WN51_02644 [Melipona quadrifasciata]
MDLIKGLVGYFGKSVGSSTFQEPNLHSVFTSSLINALLRQTFPHFSAKMSPAEIGLRRQHDLTFPSLLHPKSATDLGQYSGRNEYVLIGRNMFGPKTEREKNVGVTLNHVYLMCWRHNVSYQVLTLWDYHHQNVLRNWSIKHRTLKLINENQLKSYSFKNTFYRITYIDFNKVHELKVVVLLNWLNKNTLLIKKNEKIVFVFDRASKTTLATVVVRALNSSHENFNRPETRIAAGILKIERNHNNRSNIQTPPRLLNAL